MLTLLLIYIITSIICLVYISKNSHLLLNVKDKKLYLFLSLTPVINLSTTIACILDYINSYLNKK